MTALIDEVEALVNKAVIDDELLASSQRAIEAARVIQNSWSGSNLGYHAAVYYDDFSSPPAGHDFSREWGLSGLGFSGGAPGWRQRSVLEVHEHLLELAGLSDLEYLRRGARNAESLVQEIQDGFESVLSSAAARGDDPYLQKQLNAVRAVTVLGVADVRRSFGLVGTAVTRDPMWDGTWKIAPHQELVAELGHVESALTSLQRLAQVGRQVASHLRRAPVAAPVAKLTGDPVGAGKVFVGHGRSAEWMKLTLWLTDRLGLPADEFNRVATAGIPISDRLQKMLDDASFALLVLTGEDERADGQIVARMNVVHEVGLFQGRLGLRRAIVVLEEGCETFSNISGLGWIGFPKGNIAAAFEEIRATLEREGLLASVKGDEGSKEG